MADNPVKSKPVLLRGKNYEVLILLREFLEPLGYQVEFAPVEEVPGCRRQDGQQNCVD